MAPTRNRTWVLSRARRDANHYTIVTCHYFVSFATNPYFGRGIGWAYHRRIYWRERVVLGLNWNFLALTLKSQFYLVISRKTQTSNGSSIVRNCGCLISTRDQVWRLLSTSSSVQKALSSYANPSPKRFVDVCMVQRFCLRKGRNEAVRFGWVKSCFFKCCLFVEIVLFLTGNDGRGRSWTCVNRGE